VKIVHAVRAGRQAPPNGAAAVQLASNRAVAPINEVRQKMLNRMAVTSFSNNPAVGEAAAGSGAWRDRAALRECCTEPRYLCRACSPRRSTNPAAGRKFPEEVTDIQRQAHGLIDKEIPKVTPIVDVEEQIDHQKKDGHQGRETNK